MSDDFGDNKKQPIYRLLSICHLSGRWKSLATPTSPRRITAPGISHLIHKIYYDPAFPRLPDQDVDVSQLSFTVSSRTILIFRGHRLQSLHIHTIPPLNRHSTSIFGMGLQIHRPLYSRVIFSGTVRNHWRSKTVGQWPNIVTQTPGKCTAAYEELMDKYLPQPNIQLPWTRENTRSTLSSPVCSPGQRFT